MRKERHPKVQAARVREPAAPAPAPVEEPTESGETGQVLALQRTVGNNAVTSLLVQRAAAAPTAGEAAAGPAQGPLEIPEVTLGHMHADVDRIQALLQKQILWSSEESEIVGIVRHWTEVDRLNLESGHSDTRNIDKFLLLLKTRVFPRATARSAWQETWVNAFDTLWYELEDDRLQQFAALVATSQKQATAGPADAPSENFWSTLGKQEALGVWGVLKGMGLTLSGLADAAVWYQWKISGLPLRTVLDALGVKLGAEPPQLTPWLEKQYDDVAKEMGHAFGIDPTKDETLLGQSSYEIGEFGGKIVGALTLAGAGEAGGAAEGVQVGLKALQLAQALQGIDQSIQKIADRILEIREARPTASWDEILLDAKVLLEAANILTALLSVFGSFEDAAPTFTEAFKKLKLPVALISIAPLLQKAWIDYNDPQLATDKEKRDKALRDDVAAIMSAVAVLLGTTLGGKSGGEEGKGGKDGKDGGGGEGGGGGGGDSPFGEGGGELGDGTVLEPHPADPTTGEARVDPETGKSLPEFIDDTGTPVDPETRRQLLEGGGGEIGEPEQTQPNAPAADLEPGPEDPGAGFDDEVTKEIRVPDELREGQGGPGPNAPESQVIDQSTSDRYLVIDSENSRFKAEAHLENGNELSLTLRTELEGQRSSVLRGSEQFNAIMEHFGGQIEAVRGSWSYGSNLEAFNTAIAGGATPEQAARQTWTGGRAGEHGYTQVQVKYLEGSPGNYTKVEVLFKR